MTITNTGTLFTVVGATGGQGKSTVEALKSSKISYRVRALTRDATKPAAKELESLGCEIVEADINTREGAEQAFAGSDVVFGMTFSDYDAKENEYKKGVIQVDAAKTVGVKTFLWSSQLNLGKLGGMEVPIFDVKAEVADYARSVGLKIIEICPGSFSSNFLGNFFPRKQDDGSIVFLVPLTPDTKVPLINIEADFGKYTVDALEKSYTKPVLASSEYITPVQMAQAFSDVIGRPVSFSQVDDEIFRSTTAKFVGEGLANNLLNMFTAYRTIGYYLGQDLTDSNAILSSPAQTISKTLKS